ncbi:MAG: alpha/beta fold hydrolase [Pseudomonadota bacterium]|nr:alpha/beta fold hydrolase [Pseudomonadota bacterium]
MTQTFDAVLPHGITLSCRAAGRSGLPVLLFLHGFPEAAFIWDELMAHFCDRYRCIAPNLRGFEKSSSPDDVDAYRAKHLVADIAALIDQQAGGRVEALIAHDWGGAVAWNLAAQRPEMLKRLIIVNSPHPATLLRELQHSPAQQAASAYMNFLCRPDAEDLLAENDYARLWPFFTSMGAADPSRPGGGWLTDELRDRYRAVWAAGLTGGCNYYRAAPLRPPTPSDDAVMKLKLPDDFCTVQMPTLVLWGEGDIALPVGLLDGLERYVTRMRLVPVPDATHWIVHERPSLVAAEIERELAG